MKLDSKEAIWSAIEDGDEIACEPWRWGTTHTHVIFREGKHYQFTVQIHSQEGLQDEEVDLHEVEPCYRNVTETVVRWRRV